jgi:CRISPR-associated endonuclease/helicase Cas3
MASRDTMRDEPLAHSPRPSRGILAQSYVKHVSEVVRGAVGRASDAAKFSPTWGDLLVAVVRLASEYHDLGKLDPENQAVLRMSSQQPLPIKHEDAGAAHFLSSQEDLTVARLLAAMLVFSHHRGLPSIDEQNAREEFGYRIRETEPEKEPLYKRTNSRLASYRQLHQLVVAGLEPLQAEPLQAEPSQAEPGQMLSRVALSCLVDADHSDTARHYGNAPWKIAPGLHPVDRLDSLDAFTERLSFGKKDDRTRLRKEVYRACREADPTPALFECDSPVGTGKTTAVMAHLLRAAGAKNLRRLFVVLPFTNIIDQAVDVYRKSLVLPGEDPEAVVAAVHHKADYKDLDSRHLAALWDAPVVVTTAVQFFETLAAASTGGLRKLHNLVGAGVFIDESHACLPAKLWPRAWNWIRQLGDVWGGHFVLGSGSLNRIWTIPEIESEPITLPPLVERSVRDAADLAERHRVPIRERKGPMTLDQLAKWIGDLPGPRLVIVNTVQIAAALARLLAEKMGPNAVMHLSTALTPHHRAITLDRVRSRLDYRTETDWTLVATSCVEAGVDVSFRTGLRQRASLSSLLQIRGRISRNNEYGDAEVWDFQLVTGGLVNLNPVLEDSAEILGEFLKKDQVSPEHCTAALKAEIIQTRRSELNKDLEKAEVTSNFPEVEKLFRVIDTETRTVVISKSLMEGIEKCEPVDWRELQRHSVQLYATKVEGFRLREAPGLRNVFCWDLAYDDFLGYMAGGLPLVDGQWQGGFIL